MPEWPGYGDSTGDELLEDMLDFALHGWDLVEALGLSRPHVVGHSMGGMIAAGGDLASPRRLAMAGKILFPIPNRRLAKRLYRLTAETLIVWGAGDRLIVPAYAARWGAAIPGARVETLGGAGHRLPYEQPEAFTRVLAGCLG